MYCKVLPTILHANFLVILNLFHNNLNTKQIKRRRKSERFAKRLFVFFHRIPLGGNRLGKLYIWAIALISICK